MPEKVKIVLDTNFLIDLCRFKVDVSEIDGIISSQYEIIVPNFVLHELEKIAKTRKKESKYARIALKQDFYRIEDFGTPKISVDKSIIDLANENTIIATNDINLRKTLRIKGIKTIYLKSKKRLVMG